MSNFTSANRSYAKTAFFSRADIARDTVCKTIKATKKRLINQGKSTLFYRGVAGIGHDAAQEGVGGLKTVLAFAVQDGLLYLFFGIAQDA